LQEGRENANIIPVGIHLENPGYDLANDPHETGNLFEEPGHRDVRAALMEKLAYRQMELADRSPLPIGRA
jgi:hypothetical protein